MYFADDAVEALGCIMRAVSEGNDQPKPRGRSELLHKGNRHGRCGEKARFSGGPDRREGISDVRMFGCLPLDGPAAKAVCLPDCGRTCRGAASFGDGDAVGPVKTDYSRFSAAVRFSAPPLETRFRGPACRPCVRVPRSLLRSPEEDRPRGHPHQRPQPQAS